jgi:hypothetical protein
MELKLYPEKIYDFLIGCEEYKQFTADDVVASCLPEIVLRKRVVDVLSVALRDGSVFIARRIATTHGGKKKIVYERNMDIELIKPCSAAETTRRRRLQNEREFKDLLKSSAMINIWCIQGLRAC